MDQTYKPHQILVDYYLCELGQKKYTSLLFQALTLYINYRALFYVNDNKVNDLIVMLFVTFKLLGIYIYHLCENWTKQHISPIRNSC